MTTVKVNSHFGVIFEGRYLLIVSAPQKTCTTKVYWYSFSMGVG